MAETHFKKSGRGRGRAWMNIGPSSEYVPLKPGGLRKPQAVADLALTVEADGNTFAADSEPQASSTEKLKEPVSAATGPRAILGQGAHRPKSEDAELEVNPEQAKASSLNVNAANFVPNTTTEKTDPMEEALESCLNELSLDPALFSTLEAPMIEALEGVSPQAMERSVALLVNKGTADINLQFTIAKFCEQCSCRLSSLADHTNFRHLFLGRLKSEYDSCLQQDCDDTRLQQFCRFLAEVYLIFKTTHGSRFELLGFAIRDMVSALLGRNTVACTKAALLVLKLCGAAIEEDERKASKTERGLDSVFEKLSRLAEDPQLPPNVSFLAKSVCKLRSDHWIVADCISSAKPVPDSFLTMDPVFFESGVGKTWAEVEYEPEKEVEDFEDFEIPPEFEAMPSEGLEEEEDGHVLVQANGSAVSISALEALRRQGICFVNMAEEGADVSKDFEQFLKDSGQA